MKGESVVREGTSKIERRGKRELVNAVKEREEKKVWVKESA